MMQVRAFCLLRLMIMLMHVELGISLCCDEQVVWSNRAVFLAMVGLVRAARRCGWLHPFGRSSCEVDFSAMRLLDWCLLGGVGAVE